jgi:3-oxoacyl-[acyl-carrier-protein] synthase II
MKSHEVVITGIGLVSSLGEGLDAHWKVFSAAEPKPVVDATRFAPFPVHGLPEIDWGTQIPKRGDLRQMDNWQRLGVHAAGLALDDAGLKDDAAACATMDMTVAAGGGARDLAVDESILAVAGARNDLPVFINQVLSTDLRPTLFLAQLSNLLAGNISIVHKVTGSSRTFMGEEGAGISAVEHAVSRIRSGQSSHALVGGAYYCESLDFLLALELGGLLHEGEWRPVWQRGHRPGGGMVLGSGAAFLILENRARAEARGARIYASISGMATGQARRGDDYSSELARLFAAAQGSGGANLVLSGASGARLPTGAERQALDSGGRPFRAVASTTGHLKEAQLPFTVALAALAVNRGGAPGTAEPGIEKDAAGPIRSVLATTVGFVRAEGAVLVAGA